MGRQLHTGVPLASSFCSKLRTHIEDIGARVKERIFMVLSFCENSQTNLHILNSLYKYEVKASLKYIIGAHYLMLIKNKFAMCLLAYLCCLL